MHEHISHAFGIWAKSHDILLFMVKDQRSKVYSVFVNVMILGRNEDPSLYIQCDWTISFCDSFYGKADKVMSFLHCSIHYR